jgi:hypothetical protein
VGSSRGFFCVGTGALSGGFLFGNYIEKFSQFRVFVLLWLVSAGVAVGPPPLFAKWPENIAVPIICPLFATEGNLKLEVASHAHPPCGGYGRNKRQLSRFEAELATVMAHNRLANRHRPKPGERTNHIPEIRRGNCARSTLDPQDEMCPVWEAATASSLISVSLR